MSKFRISLLVAVSVLLGLLLWNLRPPPSPERAPSISAPKKAPSPPLPSLPVTTGGPTSRPPFLNTLGTPATAASREPTLVFDVCTAYRRQFGVFPTGEDNAHIIRLLLGENPARLPFIPAGHPRLNPIGELVDAWGTPFFFHVVSHDEIQICSAGPDHELYTADDITAPPPRSQSPVR